MRRKSVVAVIISTLLAGTALPAHAESTARRDKRSDVEVSYDVYDDNSTTQKQGYNVDLAGVAVSNAARRITAVIKFHRLAREFGSVHALIDTGGHPDAYFFFLVTRYDREVVFRLMRKDATGSEYRCLGRVEGAVDFEARRMTITAPRRCLADPAHLRARATFFKWFSDSGPYTDDYASDKTRWTDWVARA